MLHTALTHLIRECRVECLDKELMKELSGGA